MEYIICDRNFIILQISNKAVCFADSPEVLDIGKDIRNSFPEIIGIEDSILESIDDFNSNTWEIRDVNRVKSDKNTIYFNLSFLKDRTPNRQQQGFILLIEETTQTTLFTQQVNQLLNENSLAIDNLVASENQIKIQLRLYQERDRVLGLITQQIHQSLDLMGIFQTTASEVRKSFKCERLLFYQYQLHGPGKILVETVTKQSDYLTDKNEYLDYINSYLDKYFDRQIYALENIYLEQLTSNEIAQLEKFKIKAQLIIPLMLSGSLWGLIIIDRLDRTRKWLPEEIDFLQQLSQQLAIAIQQSELNQHLEEVNRTNIDRLTGIANRHYLERYLKVELRRMARQKQPISLILVDLESFQDYNDCYGYLAGNFCLQTVANTLIEVIKRPADLVARYSVTEFAVVLPNTQLDGALYVANIISDRFKQNRIPQAQSSLNPTLSLSIGVVNKIPQRDLSSEQFITMAIHALNQAKQEGRNAICY